MASTITGFAFTELIDGSGRGHVEQDGTAQRVFKVNWADMPAFMEALMGGWRKLTPDTFQYVKPDQHPDWPVFYCQAADYEPLGVPSMAGGVSAWEFAKITASYKPLKFDPSESSPGDNVTEDLDFDIDVINIPGGTLQTSSGNFAEQDVKILLPCVSYTVTIRNAPTLPGGNIQKILSLLGTVNSDAFKGAEAKKMLFLGARASRSAASFSSLNSQNWKIEYKFKYRPVEWTKVYVRASGDFVEVTDSVTGRALYNAADLAQLLPS